MLSLTLLFFFVPAGVILALAAVWLTTTKGNTIRDIVNSKQFKDTEAVKTEILGKVKLSSNIPIVALYVIAAIVICLPLSVYFFGSPVSCINISGKVKTSDTVKIENNVSVKMSCSLPPKELPAGVEFNIPVLIGPYIDKPMFKFESDNYDFVTIGFNIRDNNIIFTSSDYNWGDGGVKKWNFYENDINLDDIILRRSTITRN